jgi:hypothetical protein
MHSLSGGHVSVIAIPEGAYTIIPIHAVSRHKGMWGTDANERSA